MHSEKEFEEDALRKSMLESGDENRKSGGFEERVVTLEKQLEERVSALDKQLERVSALQETVESRLQELQELRNENTKSCCLAERVDTLEKQLEERVSALDKECERVSTLEQQVEVRFEELEVRLCAAEGELFLVAEAVSTDESGAVSSPLESGARASQAPNTTTPARNTAHGNESGGHDRRKWCASCQRSGCNLTVCDQCKERFCRTCQLWCSTKLGGCGARVCEGCNKKVSKTMQILEWRGKWRCGYCHYHPR